MAKVTAFNADEFLLQLSDRLKESAYLPDIKKYKPHEKQALFHASPKKKKLYIGGNRSGKTTGGVTEAIWRATCRHPYRPDLNAIGPNRGRVVGVDFVNGVEKIIFPQYRQWLYPSALRGGAWETAYDKFTRTLYFDNGSFIEFMSYDQDLDKFAGTSRHWIHFDEEPPQSIFVECMARLIDTNGEYWITMTPVEGMTWIYDELYEKNVGNEDGPVLVIEINTFENPYLSEQAITDFLESVDEDEVTSRVEGKFVRQGGRIYKNFDPTPGGLHVLTNTIENPREYLKDWLWICSLDHGLNNPTAVLWTGLDTNGFGVVFEEHYKREMTVDQHAKVIIDIMKRHGRAPDIMVADPSIAQRNGVSGTSIQEEYAKHGLYWTLGNNDVKAGIIRVKRYWNQTPYVGKRTHPLFVDSNDASIDKFPRLRVTPNCSNLISEAKRYRWKTYRDKRLQYENNPYDEPHKKDDHAMDSLRYALMTQPNLFAENDQIKNSSDFKNALDKAMNEISAADVTLRDAGFIDPLDRGISDPHGLKEGGWTEANDLPNRYNDGWTFDEHMGMNY